MTLYSSQVHHSFQLKQKAGLLEAQQFKKHHFGDIVNKMLVAGAVLHFLGPQLLPSQGRITALKGLPCQSRPAPPAVCSTQLPNDCSAERG